MLGDDGRHHFDFLPKTGRSSRVIGADGGEGSGHLQEVLFDFTGHPAAEDERFLHPGGSEELQRVVDHGNVAQRQQSLSAITDGWS